MRLNTLIASLSLILAAAPAVRAQEPPASGNTRAKTVSYDDLLAMVKQGKDAPAILGSCETIFTFSAEQRDKLLKAGAASSLIDALQRKRMHLGDVRNVALILDVSGSMADETPDGQTKMEAAKKVVSDLIERIPAGRNLCFIVYGHDVSLKCEAVKVVRPLGPLQLADRAALRRFVAGLKPTGYTPIAKSLRVAGEELAKAEGLSQVVLITDGEETCDGDPAKEAEKLAVRENIRAVEVIALGLTDKEKESVREIARRGRGRFYDAQTAKDLGKAVGEATDVPLVPPVAVEPKIPKVENPKQKAVVIEEGFTPLFNGKDFAGWEAEGGDPKAWSVERGELAFTNRSEKSRNWLNTKAEYGDFVLRLEFQLTKGANSGVCFRYRPGDDKVFRAEVQVLDDRNPGGDTVAKRKTGSLYDLAIDHPAGLNPLGEWNVMEVKVQGREVTVTVNGHETVSRHLDRFADKATKMPGLSRDSGRIGLQNWTGSGRFRNIRIKELKADGPAEVQKEPLPADLTPAVRNLIEALSDEDAGVRATSATSLAKFKHAAVVAALCRALKDKEGRVRRAAADSLATIGDKSAADALAGHVKDAVWVPFPGGFIRYDPNDPPAYDGGGKDWGSKEHALKALKQLAPDKVAEALAAAVKARTPEVRRWAAAALAAEKGETVVTALAGALSDSDGQARRAAADGLAKIGEKSEVAVEALVKRIGDTTWLARPGGFISYDPSDPPAYDDHEDWGSKHHALQALRKLAPDRVEEALSAALTSKNSDVRKWAVKQLAKEKGKNP